MQFIGIGSSANDNTGDPLRTAFDKVNKNFAELTDEVGGINTEIDIIQANMKSTLASLNDVSITTVPATNEVLAWNGTKWSPSVAVGGAPADLPSEWIQTIGNEFNAYIAAMSASDSDHNVWIAGYLYRWSSTPYNAGFIAKFDKTGKLIFIKDLSIYTSMYIESITVDSLGNCIVLSEISNSGTYPLMIKVSPIGEIIWTKEFNKTQWQTNPTNPVNDRIIYSSIDNNDRSWLMTWGGKKISDNEQQFYMHRILSDGTFDTTATVTTTVNDTGAANTTTNQVDSLGNIYVFTGHTSVFTLSKFQSDGTPLWTKTIQHIGIANPAYWSMGYIKLNLDHTRISLSINNGTEVVYITFNTNDGSVIWKKNLSITGHAVRWAIDEQVYDQDNNLYGMFVTNAADKDFIVYKFSPLGTLLWVREIGTIDFDATYYTWRTSNVLVNDTNISFVGFSYLKYVGTTGLETSVFVSLLKDSPSIGTFGGFSIVDLIGVAAVSDYTGTVTNNSAVSMTFANNAQTTQTAILSVSDKSLAQIFVDVISYPSSLFGTVNNRQSTLGYTMPVGSGKIGSYMQHVGGGVVEWKQATLNIKEITANYTITPSDSYSTMLNVNSTSTVNITVDNNYDIPIGASILIGQIGTGAVNISALGVTIRTPETLTISKRYGKVTIIKVGESLWEVEGNLLPL